jgi:N-acetylneuraminic acid mutarotase
MKKCIIVVIAVLFIFLCGNTLSATPNTWTQKADFGGTARSMAVGFSIGDKGYIGTGSDSPTSRRNDFWEYDPASNTWTQKADFGGTGRFGAVGFSIEDKGYIGTGYAGSNTRDFWEYDPAANTWTQKADFGGTERQGAVGFSIGSRGYIGTGYSTSYTRDFWEYDPAANTWTQKADFGGTGRSKAVGFSIGSKGYIGTGNTGSNTSDFWEYDSTANIWTQKADFGGTARESATGFSIGSKAYIGTGDNGIYPSPKDFWEYNPVANTWARKAEFGGTVRYSAVGFSIGSKGYIGTGSYTGTRYKTFWEYDSGPFTDVFSTYWAYNYIMAVYNAGYTTGYGAGIFAPELNVTREQMAAFIIRAKEGEPPVDYCSTGVPFPDCSADSWSCKYIKRLSELGLTTGYGTTGLFMPAYNVTRAQMAAFIVRAVQGEPAANYCASGSPFSDVTASDWSCIYIKRLYELGITTGYGNRLYGPLDLVTRAQMAAFLGRAFLGMQ